MTGTYHGIALALSGLLAAPANAAEAIIVQSTTSTANSGLYDHLLPQFEAAYGIKVHVVAVGTGQAIRNARNCDGDVLLVHAKPAEQAFVADGYGIVRTDLMFNDFIIVGPRDDPAGVAGMVDVEAALTQIAKHGALFASRGDDSGTHKKERALWASANVDPDAASGAWYRETGSGMGATLNVGVGMGAYVLTDRASWISFGNRSDFEIHVEGDDALFNQYGVIVVSADACPSVKTKPAQTFNDWLLSEAGQNAIAAFRVGGQQLFFPNAPRMNMIKELEFRERAPEPCALRVEFGSHASGIDRALFLQMSDLLSSDPGVVRIYAESFGREGERALCAVIADDAGVQSAASAVTAAMDAIGGMPSRGYVSLNASGDEQRWASRK